MNRFWNRRIDPVQGRLLVVVAVLGEGQAILRRFCPGEIVANPPGGEFATDAVE